ncbi:MAG: hypothetical protein WC091_16340 [Sulfuricellaceae bacterium]
MNNQEVKVLKIIKNSVIRQPRYAAGDLFMTPLRLFLALILSLWLLPALCAGDAVPALAIGTPVVVVVGEFPPTKMQPDVSGYSKPLVIHPGKRGIVAGLDAARKDLVIVQWKEQYWQEWTEPPTEGYLDNNVWFMSQTGKWIKWKSFTSTINIGNLKQPISSTRGHAR